MSGVLVTHSPFCFLRQGLSLNPEPASSARLPGHRAPGMLVFTPQQYDYKHAPPCSMFYGCREHKFRSSCCTGTLPTEPSPQHPGFYFLELFS